MPDVLAVGDVHGKINSLTEIIEDTDPDLVVQVGDLETVRDASDLTYLHCPPRYKEVKDYPPYDAGEKQLPQETVFIGGNHEAWNVLEPHQDGGYIIPNLYYMGRSGVIEREGLKIGGISGIFSQHYTPQNERSEDIAIDRNYFMEEDVETLADAHDLDIFLMHEWPNKMFADTEAPEYVKDRLDDPNDAGNSDMLHDLIQEIQPRHVFAGHIHIPYETTLGRSKVTCLGKVGTEGDHAVYRF